jgi:glutamate carboxypeptidase
MTIISDEKIRQIYAALSSRQAEIEKFVQELVELESPSGDETGSREVVAALVSAAERLNCITSIEKVDVDKFGRHVLIRAFQDEKPGQLLVVGHTDTVHARGSVRRRPWRREAGKIFGPGIFDMKGNCALAIEVFRTLEELKIEPQIGVALILTCDEEVGSMSGWPFIERVARSSETAFAMVLEPPASGGRVKTGRKGTGIFTLKVEGRAAHAGLEPEKGASAILELARQTERIHSINKAGAGITVNVGVVRGGTRSNVVPAEAEAEIDVRFSNEREAEEIEQFLLNLRPIDERTRVFVSGGINRPPLERTPAVVSLFEKARSIARVVNFDLGDAQVGGASDGNFLAALGIPVLDGLGINGDGAHADHENIVAADIPIRGTLIAGLIASA